MWVVSGPFDGEIMGEVGFQKSKLLKPSTSYPLGRKDRKLVVSSKKISHDHCELKVGPFSNEDVSDPANRPSLEFLNKKDKIMRVKRGEQDFEVIPSSRVDLQDGDVVAIVGGVNLSVEWRGVCCYAAPARGKSPVSIEACASLGIHIVHLPHAQVTHHLTASYAASALIAASLITACQFVKVEWLQEVIRLGSLSSEDAGTSLETSFILPPINKFRPSFSPSLPPSQKVFKVWEPNEERLRMFQDHRFICVGDKGREIDSDIREAVNRAGGSIEVFDAHGGKLKWHRALTRGRAKEGKTLVLIGDPEALQSSIGQDDLSDLVDEAKEFGLSFINPDAIVQAVLAVDVSILHSEVKEVAQSPPPKTRVEDSIEDSRSRSSTIPEPQPEGETVDRSRRLVRRATSRQASQEPKPSVEVTEDTAPVRRVLTRRVHAGVPITTGIDDVSSILQTPPVFATPTYVPPSLTADTMAGASLRSTRLKRRVPGAGVTAQEISESEIFSVNPTTDEPPLKKFKALFEASNPDRASGGTIDESTYADLQTTTSQTQAESQTQARESRTLRSGAEAMPIVREEEEETQPQAVGAKRKALDDVDMVDGNDDSGQIPTTSKKRAIEDVNSVQRATSIEPSIHETAKKERKGGAQAGKPDTDVAFLKALASTKRGKKHEDAFDREFNKLKISKPELGRDEPEQEWHVLDDFAKETNIRGNFMVVVDLDVFKAENGRGPTSKHQESHEWEGKPNFKRFKRKDINAERRPPVELFVSDEADYTPATAYWKSANSQSQSQPVAATTQPRKQVKVEANWDMPSTFDVTKKGKSPAMIIDDSDDEDMAPAPRAKKGKVKVASRAGSAVPPPSRTTTRGTRTTATRAQPLFLESDEEIQNDLAAIEEEQTLESPQDVVTRKRPRQPPSRAKKTPAPILDDDSDDGMFRSRRR